MTYLGYHENVVNLIGAVTSEIQTRKLLMVVEFCAFGSLLEHLRAIRGLYVNTVKEGEIINLNQDLKRLLEQEENVSTLDLIKWATQISRGMEYLSILKIVHGDLAARNLLLTETKQIKIADFGLARQLYQYSVYVKRQKTPLPWRSLAIESITDMNFSTQSDVWSFGIVLYELFTLGQVPYLTLQLQFTFEFIERLKNGMRLEQPKFCPDIVYHYMIKCWNENPVARPSFQDLHQYFHSLTKEISKRRSISSESRKSSFGSTRFEV